MTDPGWSPAIDNLRQIKEIGLERWLEGQKKRQLLVEELLENYNEGRSMSFYCKAAARMPVESINKAITEAKKVLASEKVNKSDVKSKAKIMKTAIKNSALDANVSL